MEVRQHQKKLEEMRADLADKIRRLEKEEMRCSCRESTGDLSGYSQHMAETAAASFEQERRIGLISRETDILYEIDEALYRIRDGKFGICEGCGEEINSHRLEAVPYARFCIECQKKMESNRR
ncbi:MAG: TraR/DksA C4-type zinc finger protein [bacterium]